MYQKFTKNFSKANSREKVEKLRQILTKKNLDGFIIPQNDRFQGEFLSYEDLRLEWISGFSGSAGLAIIMKNKAAIFVDGRYETQSNLEVDKKIFKTVSISDLTISDWINNNYKDDKVKIGFDPWLFSINHFLEIKSNLKNNIILKHMSNPIDIIWKNKNKEVKNYFFIHPIKYSGLRKEKKIDLILNDLDENYNFILFTKPDSICWLLNIRGKDYPHNPLLKSYAILYKNGSIDLFFDLSKLNVKTKKFLKDINFVDIKYFETFLSKFKKQSIRIDSSNCPYAINILAKKNNIKLIDKKDPCIVQKAIKNSTEIKNAQFIHKIDGIAFINFLYWLDKINKKNLDEITIIKKLEEFRIKTKKLEDISFDTICGSGPNGAIIHYKATKNSNRNIEENEILLIDSGGQYKEGTTDITRTLTFGKVSQDFKTKYNSVLKGMINLSKFKWPIGLTGRELDVIARTPLWERNLDYNHGTGHGVGSFLSVHEGPQSISKKSEVVIKPGMLISNEPGYYEKGKYGIRIENILLVKKDPNTTNKKISLMFETLTLAPISTDLIDKTILNEEEIRWINNYHKKVFKNLENFLDPEKKKWLRNKCKKI